MEARGIVDLDGWYPLVGLIWLSERAGSLGGESGTGTLDNISTRKIDLSKLILEVFSFDRRSL
jgi:hypothetical protein